MAALVVVGGRALKGGESVVTVDRIDPATETAAEDGADMSLGFSYENRADTMVFDFNLRI